MLKRPARPPQRSDDKTRVNEAIKSPEIRVIGAEGNQLGILTPREAIKLAEEAGLDLVEVSPSAKPPVCRIMDYGKYKFEIAKKAKQAKAKQHVIKVKEIKLHPKTDENDFNYRVDHAKEFLEKGFKVKVTMVFRGREMTHKEYGKRLLDQMTRDLEEYADVELEARMEGNSMMSIFVPSRKSLKKTKKEEGEKPASGAPVKSVVAEVAPKEEVSSEVNASQTE